MLSSKLSEPDKDADAWDDVLPKDLTDYALPCSFQTWAIVESFIQLLALMRIHTVWSARKLSIIARRMIAAVKQEDVARLKSWRLTSAVFVILFIGWEAVGETVRTTRSRHSSVLVRNMIRCFGTFTSLCTTVICQLSLFSFKKSKF